jgi:hypothetical protein
MKIKYLKDEEIKKGIEYMVIKSNPKISKTR